MNISINTHDFADDFFLTCAFTNNRSIFLRNRYELNSIFGMLMKIRSTERDNSNKFIGIV